MAFNLLTITIRGYAEDITSALKLDTIQNRLDPLVYDKIINRLQGDSKVCDVTRLSVPIHGGVQIYYDHLEAVKDELDAVLIYTSENSNKYNFRDTSFILDYLFNKKIQTFIVSLKDDGTFVELLQLVCDPSDNTKRSFSKLILD